MRYGRERDREIAKTGQKLCVAPLKILYQKMRCSISSLQEHDEMTSICRYLSAFGITKLIIAERCTNLFSFAETYIIFNEKSP